jgi:hypothetical protein
VACIHPITAGPPQCPVASGGGAGCPTTITITPTTPQVTPTIHQLTPAIGNAGGVGGARTGVFNPLGD